MPERRHPLDRIDGQAPALSGLALPVLAAAATFGFAELALNRLVSPVLAHIPTAHGARRIVETIDAGGELAFHATASLVVLGGTVFVATAFRRSPLFAAMLAASIALTLLAGFAGGAAILLLAQSAAAVAIVAVIARSLASGASPHRLAVVAAAVALLAGRMPYLLDAAADAAGGSGSAATTGAWITLAELAFVATPMLFAAGVILSSRGTVSRPASWIVAGGAALIGTAIVAVEPDYSAILSAWAVGVTLSLPAPLYIIAGAAAAFTLVSWSDDPSTRQLAIGFVLLMVAGVHVSVLHHNLTALAALALLAEQPAMVQRRVRILRDHGQVKRRRTAFAARG